MPNNVNRILLHCCCGPCTIMPLKNLLEEGWNIELYYYNPNIQPTEEYELRLRTLQQYAYTLRMPLEADVYDPHAWEEKVGIHGGPYPLIKNEDTYEEFLSAKKQRCLACYNLRFEHAARFAAEHNIPVLASTLAISPYQFIDEINESLLACATDEGITALQRNWRSSYSEATRVSRELGMYRQNYCGCRFSAEEAQAERLARKRHKERAKAQDQ